MIAAVPGISTPSRPASKASTGWHFAPVPDLNREMKRQITKAAAWPTFMGICFALRQEGRKGKTPAIRQAAKDQQRVSVGLRHLARDMGLNVSTVRRQASRLAKLGLIVVHRPNVTFRADLATGRIVTNAKGRCENTRIYLTIQEVHLRPAKAGTGAKCNHPPVGSRVQNAPTVRESLKQRTPDGLADGFGRPQAEDAGRLPAADAPGLTAGEAGGHTAAKASQERRPIVPEDAGRDEPVLPVGRILANPNARPPRGRRVPADEQREPVSFTGNDLARLEATKRRLAAEAARRDQGFSEPMDNARRRRQEPVPNVSQETAAPPAEADGAAVEPFDTEAAKAAALAALRSEAAA